MNICQSLDYSLERLVDGDVEGLDISSAAAGDIGATDSKAYHLFTHLAVICARKELRARRRGSSAAGLNAVATR